MLPRLPQKWESNQKLALIYCVSGGFVDFPSITFMKGASENLIALPMNKRLGSPHPQHLRNRHPSRYHKEHPRSKRDLICQNFQSPLFFVCTKKRKSCLESPIISIWLSTKSETKSKNSSRSSPLF